MIDLRILPAQRLIVISDSGLRRNDMKRQIQTCKGLIGKIYI